ncbi:hypothetical protein B0A52_04627 [Exophiala mesophila]|uniref:NmrA-like domain-containing protein n=1 Tax=Exophiala mesophila TaxID=212818 RepID=A0A438N8W0_EXOME|nr:hypothetical protein B0A52_04627 [Exophiala mesophila]
MSRAILVTGATGKQGSSVLQALISAKADFQYLALTRNPASASAQRLAQKSPSIKLIGGDLDHPDEIFRAAKEKTSVPIWGVFSVQLASTKAGDDTEERQGKALIDASLRNSIKHFVYSSVDRGGERLSGENPTNVGHFITKHHIEQHLFNKTQNSDMTYTVLRPVAFLENFVPGMFGKVFATLLRNMLKGKPLQLIATSDIGHFAAQSFLHPDEWRNRCISLAGDELTFDQFKKIYERKTGQTLPTTFGFIAWFILWMNKDLHDMYKWFETDGYGVDIPALKRQHPGLKDFETWLATESQFTTK